MDEPSDKGFPQDFGASIEDCLGKYGRLIYTIINIKTKDIHRLDAEELFQDFFIHITEGNFKRLKTFRKQCKPKTFLVEILKNFIKDKIKKKTQSLISLSDIKKPNTDEGKEYEIPVKENPLEKLIRDEHACIFKDTLKATFCQLSTREQLIFELSYDNNMPPRDIAESLGIIPAIVSEARRKIKKILKRELHKRGLQI
jgi:RNA polymerase sigma factor (sigma-70 family)